MITLIKTKELDKIIVSKPLTALSREQLKELQTCLQRLGNYAGVIDGIHGLKTLSGWIKFKTENYQALPELIGPASVKILKEKIKGTQTYDFKTIPGTKKAILTEALKFGFNLNQIAYILATVENECGFKPVQEAYWLSEEWRRKNLRYAPFWGRGYVQITWKSNYEKYSKLLGVDLVNNPDLALKPEYALFILLHGFKFGTFTGRKLSDYVNNRKQDYLNARRCINGTDKALLFATSAEKYLKLLNENKI
jgi:hypothetical protein